MKSLIVPAIISLLLCVVILPSAIGLIIPPREPLGSSPSSGITVKVLIEEEQRLVELDLEEYVKGVVAAEMPASFEVEALKAQAVLARTLAIRKMRRFGGTGVDGDHRADISNSHFKGQAWLSEAQLKAKWGLLNYSSYWTKISRAVEATSGMVATYEGQLIDPVYHSTSAGVTENSEDVWSATVPYLRGVECPYDDHSPYSSETSHFTFSEIAAHLSIPMASLESVAASTADEIILVSEESPTGRAKTVVVAGRSFPASEFRSKLNLRSTMFTWRLEGGQVVITTKGYGHGVGMSQYGADGLARRGYQYREILDYFYRSIQLRKVEDLTL